jgi:cell division GTPase FtsZ
MSLIVDQKFAHFDVNTHHLYLDFGPLLDINLMIGSWDKGLFLSREPAIVQGEVVPIFTGPSHNKVRPIQKSQNTQLTNSEGENCGGVSWDDPELPLIEFYTDHDPDHPVCQFLKTVPADHLILATKFRFHQLTILRLLRYFPHTKDLLESAPTLYWLLAHKVLQSGSHPIETDNILKQKRIHILDWITDGHGSKSLLKFIKKIEIKHFDFREMELLLNAIKSPTIIVNFKHFKTIPLHALRMFFQNPELLNCKFFVNSYTSSEQIPISSQEMTSLWQDTIRVGQQLDIGLHHQIIAACPTILRLRNLHDKWTAKFNMDEDDQKIRAITSKYGTDQFLAPPVSGIGTIIPIKSVQGLLDEGRVMHHCVGSFVDKVFSGTSYFYQVMEPERGTIEVSVNNGIPNIQAFNLFANQTPGKESWKVVRKWLVNHQPENKLKRIPISPLSSSSSDDSESSFNGFTQEGLSRQQSMIQLTTNEPLEARILVFGVGRKGTEFIQYMQQENMEGLKFHEVDEKDQTKEDDWQQIIRNLDMVIIVTSLGSSATSTSFCIAKTAHKLGILTVAVVTSPFAWEQQSYINLAQSSIVKLCRIVDSVISLSVQQVLSMISEFSFPDLMEQIQETAHLTIRAFTDLIFIQGLICVDFADVRIIFKESDEGRIGVGQASGDDRALISAHRAIDDHMLRKFLPYSKGVLINVTGGYDLALQEVDEAATIVREMAHKDSDIVFGAVLDEKLEGKIRVTIIASGINFFL